MATDRAGPNSFMKCPGCHRRLRRSMTFCDNCGVDVIPVPGTQVTIEERIPRDPVARRELLRSYVELAKLKQKKKSEEGK